ncbi:LD-carboxypeptidase [uncultured Sphingorhabdus sp.]|uniref:LD-carboxypeptidase n=1 Tax=uncultured Sphingorhabdus sp. TaxID=1686106 RepID=UPI002630F56C|nr:LD-carboxypeptidase [uncultured Sphingorhabdus sp.]HMS20485.1 LD-carboxypeptidase [Sphingorhabdus sp.]
MRIAICAPSTPFTREDAVRVTALAAESHPEVELVFDDQCFFEQGHFAGNDAQRLEAFVRLANDPAFDAIWFVRGGYGACRIAEDAVKQLKAPARAKSYLGYSDQGNLLAALYKAGIGWPVHGPMPTDIRREGGEEAVKRSLDWLVKGDSKSLESNIIAGHKYAAFNLLTLAMLVGTPLMPDLRGHVLMIEEVSEYLYAFDRAFFHVGEHLKGVGLAGLRLGRVSDVPENDRPFGETAEEIAQRWCKRFGISYLGEADIGHDSANKVVPFGAIG